MSLIQKKILMKIVTKQVLEVKTKFEVKTRKLLLSIKTSKEIANKLFIHKIFNSNLAKTLIKARISLKSEIYYF